MFRERLTRLVCLPSDSSEVRIQKTTFMLFGLLMCVAGMLWGLMGLAIQRPMLAAIPFSYTALVGLVFLFARRYFYYVRDVQLSLSLLLPCFYHVFAGGFSGSGAVILWSVIAPVAAQFFGAYRLAAVLLGFYSMAAVVMGFFEQQIMHSFKPLPPGLNEGAFAANILAVSAIVIQACRHFSIGMLKSSRALNRSLKLVRNIKRIQDGDYYLTALLLKPLQVNNAKASNIKIDFVVNPKKKFKFKQRSHKIGGDLCISDSIILNNKPYTVIFNADAMGKSIQGAGGALVVGAAFRSIIQRTRKASGGIKMPEVWLKNAFSDLNSLFEEFDGAMYVSFWLGLIDNNTGLLYYCNAEHPSAAVYRQKRASFLRDSIVYRKLGVPFNNRQFMIDVFQLQEDDILFIGSDGRDDVITAIDENGESVYNTDEKMFLNHIETAEGDLGKLYKLIRRMGKAIDDISLIRVRYFHKQVTSDSESELRRRINDQVGRNNLDTALDSVKQALEIYPAKSQFLTVGCQLSRKIGRLNEAVQFAEAGIIRNIKSHDHYLQAARTWLTSGEIQKAEICLEYVLTQNPASQPAVQLLEHCKPK